jgi:hypothetical protein
MNPEIFAEWLRRQGHHVIRTASSYWFDQGPRVYQAFPYHWVIQPPETELLQFLKRTPAMGLRYSTSLDFPIGHISYHAIYEGDSYDFDSLGKWARKNVRRGLKNCSVEPISFERLFEEGWLLQRDTLDRQGREVNLTKDMWHRISFSAKDLPGFEAWGALCNGRLAASVITFLMDDCIYMLYQQCHREYLTGHVNNALSFVVTRTVISRPEVRSILYGLHSLDAPANVDEFKFRMGYKASPVRQRVVFHPWLKPFFNRASYAVIKLLRNFRPGNATLAKTEGMFRFYLEGQRPLNQQAWPEILNESLSEEGTDA